MVDLLLITGLSGAGKSTTLKVLEDYGYFAIDNLPISFLKMLTKLILDTRLTKVALGVDIRSLFDSSINELIDFINNVKENKENKKIKLNVIFLTANKRKLLQRFRNTKRSHPLMKEGLSLESCIDKEKDIMKKISAISDNVIDTSEYTTKEFRNIIKSSILKRKTGIKINVVSFGYKYGIPLDADLVLDVRMLPNPFYVEELKHYSGEDKEIIEYLNNYTITNEIASQYLNVVDAVAREYSKQDRSYLNISIGCTGGRHRSVFMANKIADMLKSKNYKVKLYNRDIGKED